MLTPQIFAPNLAKKIGLNTKLYLKREDLHPFGSHKGRSIPIMIKKHIQEGWTDFVIASSGNAALAAIYTINEYNKEFDSLIKLTIFATPKLNATKMKLLQELTNGHSDYLTIQITKQTRQKAFLAEKDGQAKNLRQSTDELALLGYYDLAKELSEIDNLEAVFVPTSSGTTAQGLFEGFTKLQLHPQINIVQTTSCHPLINVNLKSKIKNQKSLASAIVDQVGQRKTKILDVLKQSHGSGWIATNQEITDAIKLVKETENIDISPNSALSIVGLMQAIKNSKYNGNICCLITGR